MSFTEQDVLTALRDVYDPELPVNIVDLGLVYDVESAEGDVRVKMTLTSPGCPAAGSLPGAVKTRVADSPGVTDVQVNVVWDPPWDPRMMSEEARLELGLL